MGYTVTVEMKIYYPDAETRGDADNEAMNLLGLPGVMDVQVLSIEEEDQAEDPDV